MKTFEIVFERLNGSIGIAQFYAASRGAAIKQFNEVYRYRDGELVSISEVKVNGKD